MKLICANCKYRTNHDEQCHILNCATDPDDICEYFVLKTENHIDNIKKIFLVYTNKEAPTVDKLTPEQLAAIREQIAYVNRNEITIGTTYANELLDHIKALEEENARLSETIDLLKQDAHPWYHQVEQENARYKEALENISNSAGVTKEEIKRYARQYLKGADEE